MPFELGSTDERLKERITFRLDKQIYEKICSEKRAISEIIRDAITEYLSSAKKECERRTKMGKTAKIEDKWVGAKVSLLLADGRTVKGTVERVENAKLFLKEEETDKQLCYGKKEIEKIEELQDE